MPRERRAQIEAVLLALPATLSGKELVPKYTELLDSLVAQVRDPDHQRNWHYVYSHSELVRIARMIENLSPAAKAGLTSGPMVNPRWLASVFREGVEEIGRLRQEHIKLSRGGQPRGRGPDLRAGAIADAAASAYALITDTTPPVVDYHGTSADHPFLRLVAGLFALAKLGASSESQARVAAARLKMMRTPAK